MMQRRMIGAPGAQRPLSCQLIFKIHKLPLQVFMGFFQVRYSRIFGLE